MSSPANVFNLQGNALHVSYSTGELGSKLELTYQDAQRSLSFTGDQLRNVSSDLGDEISVTLHLTTDIGSTTFTLFVPRIAIELNGHVAIETIGVTTLHRMPLIPPRHTQLDTYTVSKLR